MSTSECTKDHKDVRENFEDRFVKLKNVAIRLKKQLAEQQSAMELVEKENKMLINDREEQKSKYSNAQILQGEIDQIQDKLEVKSKELKFRDSEIVQTAKKLSETKSQLIDSYQENDSLSATNKELEKKMMNLEMEIESLRKINEGCNKELSTNENELSSLRMENSAIQTGLSAELSILNEVTVAELKKEISQLSDVNQHLLDENQTNEAATESTKEELQNEKKKLLEANMAACVCEDELTKAKQYAEIQAKELEEISIQQTEENIQWQKQLSEMKIEFEAYKTRAQSVLRQKAKVSDDEYSQVLLERQHMHAQLKDAENSLRELKYELLNGKDEMVLLRSEKSSLSHMNKSAAEEICSLKTSFQKDVDLLKEKLRTQTEVNHQIVETLSMHVEIANKLKLEIESLKSLHSEEVKTLKEQVKLLENSQPEIKMTPQPQSKTPTKEEYIADLEEPKFDYSSMVREDGEGSECTESSQAYHSRLYLPPTLEHLINRPLPSEFQVEEDRASVNTEISMSEYSKMESKVSSMERSAHHLSNLLAESESENVKLSQLCDVLKESIRSTSRREIREKHLENNEYLKNVVLKFLYLKTGSEKMRLVPVLQTILQLSPQESSALVQLASGDDFSNQSTAWSSYLHLWSNN